MPRVLGVTGGIASGKSLVTKMLGELGAATLSADEAAREVLAKGEPAHLEVVERFGERVVAADGEIDRAALGEIIFRNVQDREALNAITHPRIVQRISERVQRFKSETAGTNAIMAVEIPLLFECGLTDLVDETLVVAAEQETQLSRLTVRNGLSVKEAEARIASQMPIKHKTSLADHIIRNNGSVEQLRESVHRFWSQISS